MATDEVENEETENEPEIHGDVETVEGDDTTEVDAGDVTVTVAEDSDAVEAVTVAAAIETAREQGEQGAELAAALERIGALEEEVGALRQAAAAEAVATVAVAEQVEELEEEEEEESEEEEEEAVAEDRSEPRSAGAHPLFRSWGDWRGRNK